MINFVQISDLHMAGKITNAKKFKIPGLNAHDVKLCAALTSFMDEDVRDLACLDDDEELPVVVNGDVTAGGTPSQFAVANTFLLSEHMLIRSSLAMPLGLNAQADDLVSIPGNHDHWFGLYNRGFAKEVYEEFFAPPPSVSPPICRGGLELRVFTIDSCSMFEERKFNISPLANGGFSPRHKQLFRQLVRETLQEPLAEGCTHRVGVIVCHHPFKRDGSAGPLRDRCIDWLVKTASRYGIGIVLTGHTHYAWTSTVFKEKDNFYARVREVRCPTTLQFPAKLDEKRRKPGLWLHQIYLQEDQIIWKGTLALYSDGSFHIPVANADIQRPERIGWFKEIVPSCVTEV